MEKRRSATRLRMTGIILILSMFCLSACVGYQRLNVQSDVPSVPEFVEKNSALLDQYWYYSRLDSAKQAAYQELYSAVQAWFSDDDTDLSPFIYTLDLPGRTVDGIDAFLDMRLDHTLISDYFNRTLSYLDTEDSVTFYGMNTDEALAFFGGPSVVRQQVREIEAAADVFLSCLDESMSDYEKYWAIAKKLCDETKYDNEAGADIANNPGSFSQMAWTATSVYGGLVKHRSVCQGFAQTYKYLCNRAGLFCTIGNGTSLRNVLHAWNVIELDDGYYHVDITWMLSHKNRYFCLNDQQLLVDHIVTDKAIPECNGSLFAYQGKLTKR